MKANSEGGKLHRLVVRGEVIITKKEFEKINKEQIKRSLAPFANPRNLVAGSVRQLDPKITSQRHLDSTCYELITPPTKIWWGARTHQEKHKILKALGFKTNNIYSKYCRNLREVFEFHKITQKLREKFPYEIDGIIVIVNKIKIFEKLGVVGKAPRAAVAYKFSAKEATTIVENIKIQVGRTGVLTPVAVLKPVEIGGVKITKATLHNFDQIKKLGLKIGDTIIVSRAGDVIPRITRVLKELRTGKEKNFKIPEVCPIDGSKIIKENVFFRCSNPKCRARNARTIRHFVSKPAFNIEGLGLKIIDRFLDQGLISDASDIFELKEGDIAVLPGFGQKSAENLVKAIQSWKKIPLPKFIYALGIRNVGEETAQHLAETFGSIQKLKKASLEELQKITDVGPVVAKSIFDWFQEKRNLEFLEKLKKSGIEVRPPRERGGLTSAIQSGERRGLTSAIQGKTFVLTGGLEKMTREEAKEKIRLLGGEISESISKKTDFLVVGKDPGSKFQEAKKLGLKMLNEQELLKLLKSIP